VLMIAVPAAISEATSVGALRGRRSIYVVAALGAVAIAALVLGVMFPERFLSPGDASLSLRLFGALHWELPALVTPNVTLDMGHEALIGAGLAIASIAWLWFAPADPSLVRSPGERIATFIIIGLALVIALPMLAVEDPQGLGFRLRIVAFLPMALCAAVITRGVVHLATRASARRVVPIAIAVVLAVVTPHDRVEGRILAHPAMVSAVEGLAGRIPSDGVAIVPERHIAFMVTWYTGVPFRQRPEGVPREHRYRVMPLAFIGIDSPLDEALSAAREVPGLAPPIGTHPRHPNGLVLVAEPTWDWVLAQLPPGAHDHFVRWPTI